VRRTLAVYAAAEPTLHLVVFLGSASRGDAGGSADFEIGYVADPEFDAPTFQELAASVLDLEKVAIANLKRSPTTAFRAAREGALVFERTPHSFAEFRERTIHNWCEMAPVVNAVYDRIEANPPGAGPR
jgi:predicted nucleotidyltransferase